MIDYIVISEMRMKKLRTSIADIKKLEKSTNVKIRIEEEVEIESEDSLQIMKTKEIIKAFGRGFNFNDAFDLLDDSNGLYIIDIKQFSGKSQGRLQELRGRVIGRNGKTKRMIEKIADVKLSIYGKTVGIIGKWEMLDAVNEAIQLLLGGSKHGNAYRFLETCLKNRELSGG